jgi:hypothetical protein
MFTFNTNMYLKITQNVQMEQEAAWRPMIGSAQIRAASGLLDVNQTKLSEWASISVQTIKRIESSSGIRGTAETLWKIQTALEAARRCGRLQSLAMHH